MKAYAEKLHDVLFQSNIESVELTMLKQMSTTIEQDRPVPAIYVYHTS